VSDAAATIQSEREARVLRLVAPMYRRYAILFTVLVITVGIVFLLAVGVGPRYIPPGEVLEALWRSALGLFSKTETGAVDAFIVTQIRLPRAVLAVLVGGVLAVSGAALQGLFRNPLADAGLVGISSGAGLAATVMIVLGGAIFGRDFQEMGKFALPMACFAGALATTTLVYSLAQRGGRTVVAIMLLAGVAIAALCGAIIGVMIFIANDQQLRTIQFWNLGSLSGASWDTLKIAAPALLFVLFIIPRWSHRLNAMLLGEAEAQYMGVNVERMKSQMILLVALGIGTSVALTGGIGFVGLVVPHLVRLALGPDHRRLMPCSILLGAILLLAADVLARTMHPPAEIPIGILTALIGAPFFLWLLLKKGPGGLNA